MDKPCCRGVVRSAEGLKGAVTNIGNELPFYYTAPTEGEKNLGVIVVHDIFGSSIPNCRFIVDFLASNGFHAAVPDFYRGKQWAEDGGFGPDFGAWFGPWMTPEYWGGAFKTDFQAAADELKAKGAQKIACIGFCWGGKAASVAATLDGVSAAVSLHGVAHDASSVEAAKCPLLFISPAGDEYFPEEKHEEIRKYFKEHPEKKGDMKTYQGVGHGFVSRPGDTEEGKKRSDEAMNETVDFLKAQLTTEAKM
eukprot:TRINITY_DN93830_c0_g1_i1.p1 TRINITY_DN93830_c0_g1~~TRINITY_DN93830_c0_g1_i1.p1  ORF type:complete len:251 (+),score=65.57 TRINITY_DN93830_c0_g1_i1:27-779(+)